MKNIAWMQVGIAAVVGMIAGAAYGDRVPVVNMVAAKLPGSSLKKA